MLTALCLLLLVTSSSALSPRDNRRHSRASLPISSSIPSSSPPPFTPFTTPLSASPSAPGLADPVWSVNASTPIHAVSPDLWGIFFEEFAYSGHGGLHQGQIRNANFETALADYAPWAQLPSDGVQYVLQLSTDYPLNAYNPTSLQVTTTAAEAGRRAGIHQDGFWGISLIGRAAFDVSLFAHSNTIKEVTAAITSANGSTVYGSITLTGIKSTWTRLAGQVKVSGSDPSARFVLSYVTTAKTDRIGFDVVGLLPTEGWNGLQFIRPDLGALLAAMQPSFVRYPGGCYVEGDRLANRFNWKRALGPMEERTGHWDLWSYYSEDALGIYEYALWVEKLVDAYGQPTRSIWVVNVGVAHSDSIPPRDIAGWVQDGMDSIEFFLGAPDTAWGSVRAAMGHPAPFLLQYVALGNEDCGKPYYAENYAIFFATMHAAYPNITLISNCAPDQINAEVQLWDCQLTVAHEAGITYRLCSAHAVSCPRPAAVLCCAGPVVCRPHLYVCPGLPASAALLR